MARKTIPARPSRDRSRDDESLLLRSAESLGRMIGSLQRQLDVATNRLAGSKPNGSNRRKTGSATRAAQPKNGATRKTTAARKSAKKR